MFFKRNTVLLLLWQRNFPRLWDNKGIVILILIVSSMSDKHNSFSIHHAFRVVFFNFYLGFQVLCLCPQDALGRICSTPAGKTSIAGDQQDQHMLCFVSGMLVTSIPCIPAWDVSTTYFILQSVRGGVNLVWKSNTQSQSVSQSVSQYIKFIEYKLQTCKILGSFEGTQNKLLIE